MLDYQRVHANRVLTASVGGQASVLTSALDSAALLLKDCPPQKLAIVLSAQHSNEDNFALLKLGRDDLKVSQLFFGGKAPGTADDVLRNADKNPNTAGVKKLAPTARPLAELKTLVETGAITHALVLGADAPTPDLVQMLGKLKGLVVLAVEKGPLASVASVLLPASSWAESEGTFVNARGLSQQSDSAIKPQGDSRPAWKLIAALAVRMGLAVDWRKLDQLEQSMRKAVGAGAGQTTGASAGGASAGGAQ